MQVVHLSPTWFFGYDVILELVFAFVSFLVAFYAFKIYRITQQRKTRLFGLSFIFISIAYLLEAIINYFILLELRNGAVSVGDLLEIHSLNVVGVYSHLLFMIIGLVMLAYMTFNTEDVKVFLVMLTTSILVIFTGKELFNDFYLLTVVYLFVIAWYYLTNYRNNKRKSTLAVALAFFLLFLGNVQFVLSITNNVFYVLGHIIELIAYFLILLNFYLVRKKQ